MSPTYFGFFLCLFVASMNALKWDELHVRWAALPGLSKVTGTAFFSLPMTATDANNQGYVKAASDNDAWRIWCLPDDPRVCILTDKRGFICGLDIGIPKSDLRGTPYNVSEHSKFKLENRFGQAIARGRLMWVNPDVLEAGGRQNMDDGLGTGLWFQDGDSYEKIPLTEKEIESQTTYTRQSCIGAMGRHYYKDMNRKLDCKKIDPFFLLTSTDGDVHGVGFQSFGKYSSKERVWFEHVPYFAVRYTIPRSPDCLVDWAEKYGIISLHVYFVRSPWDIDCGGLLGTGYFSV